MVTSIGSEVVVRESYRAGVTAFLVKPFKSERLLNVVTSALTASSAK
jgi:FixJ family two-component response regulator